MFAFGIFEILFVLLLLVPIIIAIQGILLRASCSLYNRLWGLTAPTASARQVPELKPNFDNLPAPTATSATSATSVEMPNVQTSQANQIENPYAAPSVVNTLPTVKTGDGVPVPRFGKVAGIVLIWFLISLISGAVELALGGQHVAFEIAKPIFNFLLYSVTLSAMLPTSMLRAMAVVFFMFLIVLAIMVAIAVPLLLLGSIS